MSSDENIEKVWGSFVKEMLDKAIKERGHANILISGISGVGKTTLINEIFGEGLGDNENGVVLLESEVGKTGIGAPVTTNIEERKKDGIPIVIFDTPGLELEQFEATTKQVKDLITTRSKKPNHRDHIHIAWICILESSDRIEDGIKHLVNTLTDLGIPTIVILTKCESKSERKGYTKEGIPTTLAQQIKEVMPNQRGIIRTRALKDTYEDEDDGRIRTKYPFGLDTLVRRTLALVPEAQQNAIRAAQKIDISLKREKGQKCVIKYTTTAGVGSFIPIAGFGAGILSQIAMLIEINVIWGLPATESFIIPLCVGTMQTGFVFSNLGAIISRFIPFLGTIPSSILNSTITGVVGEAYIATLYTLSNKDLYKKFEAREILNEFELQAEIKKEELRNKLKNLI